MEAHDARRKKVMAELTLEQKRAIAMASARARMADAEQQNMAVAQSAQQTAQNMPRKWSDVPLEAASNLPKSGGEFAKGIYQAIRHPVDTAGNLFDVAAGGLRNVMPGSLVSAVDKIDPNAQSGRRAGEKASAVGQFYKDRYGGIENLKNTLATDPVGSAADLSAIFSGGAMLAPKASTIGNALRQTGNAINPVSIAAKGVTAGAKGLGKLSSEIVGGIGTRTGGESILQAGKAGFAGGETAKQFSQNLRGQAPLTDVLETAKMNLDDMARARAAQYRQGMASVSGDKTILNFSSIDKSVLDAGNKVRFGSQIKNPKAAEVLQSLSDEINNWKQLDPAQYHTPEGLDALKQKISGIVDSIPYEEKTARMVGNQIYQSIKGEITKQAPAYAKVMKDYSEATDLIREIERTLTGTDKTSVDTAMRKLQSLMRNNVNTNYGNRSALAKELVKGGGRDIMPALAGQSLNTWTPRGLGNAVAGLTGLGAHAYGGMGLSLPVLAMQSPRLVGEAAMKSGQMARTVAKTYNTPARLSGGLLTTPEIANILYQTGRLPQ